MTLLMISDLCKQMNLIFVTAGINTRTDFRIRFSHLVSMVLHTIIIIIHVIFSCLITRIFSSPLQLRPQFNDKYYKTMLQDVAGKIFINIQIYINIALVSPSVTLSFRNHTWRLRKDTRQTNNTLLLLLDFLGASFWLLPTGQPRILGA